MICTPTGSPPSHSPSLEQRSYFTSDTAGNWNLLHIRHLILECTARKKLMLGLQKKVTHRQPKFCHHPLQENRSWSKAGSTALGASPGQELSSMPTKFSSTSASTLQPSLNSLTTIRTKPFLLTPTHLSPVWKPARDEVTNKNTKMDDYFEINSNISCSRI